MPVSLRNSVPSGARQPASAIAGSSRERGRIAHQFEAQHAAVKLGRIFHVIDGIGFSETRDAQFPSGAPGAATFFLNHLNEKKPSGSRIMIERAFRFRCNPPLPARRRW